MHGERNKTSERGRVRIKVTVPLADTVPIAWDTERVSDAFRRFFIRLLMADRPETDRKPEDSTSDDAIEEADIEEENSLDPV